MKLLRHISSPIALAAQRPAADDMAAAARWVGRLGTAGGLPARIALSRGYAAAAAAAGAGAVQGMVLWPRPLERRRLEGYLAAPTADRPLMVVGPSGVGKTTLLEDVASAAPASSSSADAEDAVVGPGRQQRPAVLRFDAGGPVETFTARLEAFEAQALRQVSAARESGGPLLTYVDIFQHLVPHHVSEADVLATTHAADERAGPFVAGPPPATASVGWRPRPILKSSTGRLRRRTENYLFYVAGSCRTSPWRQRGCRPLSA